MKLDNTGALIQSAKMNDLTQVLRMRPTTIAMKIIIVMIIMIEIRTTSISFRRCVELL